MLLFEMKMFEKAIEFFFVQFKFLIDRLQIFKVILFCVCEYIEYSIFSNMYLKRVHDK